MTNTTATNINKLADALRDAGAAAVKAKLVPAQQVPSADGCTQRSEMYGSERSGNAIRARTSRSIRKVRREAGAVKYDTI